MLNIRPILGATGTLTREVFGNHSPASRAVFYLLACAALGAFGWGVFRRVRLWRLGRPTRDGFSLRAVLSRLLRDVLLQRRVFGRGRNSLAHVLLFGGFLVLFLATTLLAIEHGLAVLLGRQANDPVFHRGTYFAIYELVADAFGLAFLAGCVLIALPRRKPTAGVTRDWRDWCILAALLVLGVTGYLVEGLRIVREQPSQPGFSFVGWLAARAFESAGVTPAGASGMHFALWWFHAVLALGFVAAFPYTRMLHALAGTLRLAANRASLGKMVKLDLDEVEQTGVVGVGHIAQFTRRQLLELDACVSCGRCDEVCPAFEAGTPLSPRNLVQDIRRNLDAVGPPILAARETEGCGTPALHGDTVTAETLWSCTTCSACVAVCPTGVDPLGFITDMRRYLIAEAQLRGPPAAALQRTDRSGNPWGLPPKERLDWASGLDVPTAADRPDFDVLYWVGCAAAYDRRSRKVARAVVKLLRAAKVNFAVLGPEERCSGETARRMGDEFLFQQLAAANIETLARHGVKRGAKKIVAHCPHCVNSLKQDYAQLGGDYDVVHHTELFAQLAAEGKLPLEPSALAGRTTYHDPCYLARVGGVTEPPRRLLQLAVLPGNGRELVEMPRHGPQTACCGAGGGRIWMDDTASGERIGTSRVAEALATGADTIVVSCPFCLTTLTDGAAARNPATQVRDLAEILADSLPRTLQPESGD